MTVVTDEGKEAMPRQLGAVVMKNMIAGKGGVSEMGISL